MDPTPDEAPTASTAEAAPHHGEAWSRPEMGVDLPRARDVDPTRPVLPGLPLPVALRPLSPAALLDGAYEVLTSRPRLLLTAAAVPMVPVLLLGFLVRGGPYRLDLATLVLWDGGTEPLQEAFDDRAAAVYASAALESLALFVVGVIIARVVAAWYAGRDPGPIEALRSGLRGPLALLVAFAIVGAAQLLGGVVLCIGALVPMAWFVATAPALGVEQLGAVAAAKRSFGLTRRRFPNVLTVVVLVAIVDQLVRLALVVVPWWLADGLPDGAALVVRTVVVTLAGLVSAVFVTGAATLQYLDLRVRTEGLDLELEATDAFPTA